MHDQFFSIFVPEYSEYKDSLTEVYIDLKTQAYLKESRSLAPGQEDAGILERYFPTSFEELLRQQSGEIFLSFAEERLVSAVRARREELISAAQGHGSDATTALPAPENSDPQAQLESLFDKYPPELLLDDFSIHLQAHMTAIVEYAEKYGVNIPAGEEHVPDVVNEAVEANGPVDDALEDVPEPAGQDDLAALLQSATAKMAEAAEASKEEEQAILSSPDGLGLSRLIEQSLESDISSKDLASSSWRI